ncbi:MAG TPA: hypothetical protein VNL94_06830 [Candidatus Binatia bacterium]|nr:hypothetical protein [Candidatus Binatia bacterium]
MSGLLFIAAIMTAVAVVDYLALRFGVDSREGSTDDRAPARGISI